MIVTNIGQTSYPFGRFLKNNLILLAPYQIISPYQVSCISSTRIWVTDAHNWWAYGAKSVFHIKTTKQETTEETVFVATSEIDHWTRLLAHAVLRKWCFRLLVLISSEIQFAINSLNKSFSPADVYHSRLHEALAFCFKTGGDRNKHSARYISCRSEMAML